MNSIILKNEMRCVTDPASPGFLAIMVDLKCPRRPVLKAWSLGWCYWEVVEPFRDGRGIRTLGGVHLKRIMGLPFLFPFCSRHEVNGFILPSTMLCCLAQSKETNSS
jgi:hypothetical protein